MGKLVGVAGLALAVWALVTELPEIKRYLKMRSM